MINPRLDRPPTFGDDLAEIRRRAEDHYRLVQVCQGNGRGNVISGCAYFRVDELRALHGNGIWKVEIAQ